MTRPKFHGTLTPTKWDKKIKSVEVTKFKMLEVTLTITTVDGDILTHTLPSEERIVEAYKDKLSEKQMNDVLIELSKHKLD